MEIRDRKDIMRLEWYLGICSIGIGSGLLARELIDSDLNLGISAIMGLCYGFGANMLYNVYRNYCLIRKQGSYEFEKKNGKR